MKISIVSPEYGTGPTRGNTVTAQRWARMLRKLGNQVCVSAQYSGENCKLLIALHARRSLKSIQDFRRKHPQHPIVVALTGTDLYQDLPRSRRVRRALEAAFLIVALQPKALKALPVALRRKARFIYQSATAPQKQLPLSRKKALSTKALDVCVIGNLRAVKDPFRTALAIRDLPPASRIRVIHVGAALTDSDRRRAVAESMRNPRYRWLGQQSPANVRRILQRCTMCVLSSKAEGGANVVSEAIAAGVPVIASRIPGTVGLLGEDYPGYFSAGDTEGLRKLLLRSETDPGFLQRLRARCRRLARLFDPKREIAAWEKLLREITGR